MAQKYNHAQLEGVLAPAATAPLSTATLSTALYWLTRFRIDLTHTRNHLPFARLSCP